VGFQPGRDTDLEQDEQHIIAIAVGMLMEREQISQDEALHLLLELAKSDNFDLVDAAGIVINTKF
jgi:AmiR/NasT family two-component response regulator